MVILRHTASNNIKLRQTLDDWLMYQHNAILCGSIWRVCKVRLLYGKNQEYCALSCHLSEVSDRERGTGEQKQWKYESLSLFALYKETGILKIHCQV